MGLFKRIKNFKRLCSRDSKSSKPVIFENLEPRILFSGTEISAIEPLNELLTNETQIDAEPFETNLSAQSDSSSNYVIERTELLTTDSNLEIIQTTALSGQGLQFNLIPTEGMSQQAIDAFHEAADIFSALFNDDIIVNIKIDFTELAVGVLGMSSAAMQINSYSEVYSALLNNITTSIDNIATSSLPSGSSIDVYINLTKNNPNGTGSIVPYLDNDSDANNNSIRLTTANAKALGLKAADSTTLDATITFNSNFSWDFERSDGITSGAFDFIGVAVHEIGHALGFTSGVDYLDAEPGLFDHAYTHISPLDLYRYSDASISAGADIDWTADDRSKFFSIDGGHTSLATFSTGENYGDGRENSHWKDNLDFGIMDPTLAPGEFKDISYLDKVAWDIIGWDLSGISIQQIPYTQDFSAGKPDSSAGWEYYSDTAEGRIVVTPGGTLRMDDTTGNTTYTLNEAILHLDLTGKTNIILTLDHTSINDENTPILDSFSGHYKGDGIALSVDGFNWIKITDLTNDFTAESFTLDAIIELAKTAAGSDDVSNVRIKFQQYDNYPANSDGREFDNIKVTTNTVQSVPYTQDFESGLPGVNDGWEYYSSTTEGRIQVTPDNRLRMDDTTGNSTYTLNEAILHVDLTGKANITLTLDHWSINDENTPLLDSFSGHYKGDGIALSVDGINWIKITDLTDNFTQESFALDAIIELAKTAAGSDDVSNVRIKFQQYDNYPANSDGREFDNIKVTYNIAQSVPYTQDFESGLPGLGNGWEYYSDTEEGRIVVTPGGSLRMDDTTGNSTYTLNEAILHVDLTGKANVILTLDHTWINDEYHGIPTSFTGHYKGDGIALSVDGINWIRVTNLDGTFIQESFSLDSIIAQAKTAAGSDDVSDVRIKFQQYDNYPANSDGREFDNIKVTTNTVQSVPYTQDFESGLPGLSDGWEYYSSTTEGRIQVTPDNRLRMDDTTGNSTYTLNEAILHVNLTGKTNVTLTLDHRSIADENNSILDSFSGHYKGDGIALSVDGFNWIKITDLTGNFTQESFALDAVIELAKTAAGSDDVSDVRIKFQQYDNYPADSDGREFDNIKIS